MQVSCSQCSGLVDVPAEPARGGVACSACGRPLLFFRSESAVGVYPRDLTEKVVAIVARKLAIPAEKITPLVSFAELGADSLDTAEISMDVEARFDVVLAGADAESIRTVGDAIRGLDHALASKKP